ncbi:MAG TPA: nucleotidyltransferase family protein [Bryobacteraceae bacterium]|nr:nucleotidyltransferase family protein [Bryobacteraceae bacterium]
MQAVILAGGLGTRLRPVTEAIPKPMVPVAGAPYLEHQLRLLARQEIRDVVLLTGYLGEQIEEYFGDGSALGLRIAYSREPAPLGTGGALREARSLLEDGFLVIYGDSYLPIKYRLVMESLTSEGVVVVYDNRLGDTSVKNNIDLDDSGYVTRYEKDSPDRLSYVEAGVLAFRRSVVELIPTAGAVSLEKEVFPKLIATHELAGFVTTERFYDIGTPDRLAVIEELLGA